jgi:hypothetical protein
VRRNCLVAIVFAIAILLVGFGCESQPSAAEETEILKITVGEPTTLSSVEYDNSATLSVSRTSVVAAFYKREDTDPPGYFYSTSADGGLTWGKEMPSPGGAANGTALRDGGVIHADGCCYKIVPSWPWTTRMFRFNDDFSEYAAEMATIHAPEAAEDYRENRTGSARGPIFNSGKMVQVPNGDMIAPVESFLKGRIKYHPLFLRSSDLGRTWYHCGSVPAGTKDPNPEFPGEFLGYGEPSIALLPNGQMLAMMRTQFSHIPPDYKPMYVSWSDDLAKTWTKPVPTEPHLMGIMPTLAVLDNGVVACAYGRPGFHVAFSTDNGRTWSQRISFTDLPVPHHTGQEDMVKIGPNKLIAILKTSNCVPCHDPSVGEVLSTMCLAMRGARFGSVSRVSLIQIPAMASASAWAFRVD